MIKIFEHIVNNLPVNDIQQDNCRSNWKTDIFNIYIVAYNCSKIELKNIDVISVFPV